MEEFGLLDKWKAKYFPSEEANECPSNSYVNTSVSVEKIFSVFLVMAWGIALAFLVLLIEILLQKYYEHFSRPVTMLQRLYQWCCKAMK